MANLPLTAIYTSPLERAIETADFIARRRGLSPVVAEGLTELRLGEWEGRTFAELTGNPMWDRFNAVRSCVRPPSGEFAAEAQTRILLEVQRLAVPHAGETIALVSHGDPLRLLIAAFLGIAIDLMQRFEISPGSLSVASVAEWGPRVLSLNRTAELAL